MSEPYDGSQGTPRRRIFYEDGYCSRPAKKVKECVDWSQEDRVVITRHGKPSAVMVGVEGKDWEDLVLQTSSSFWKLIEERRKQPTISIKELRTRLRKHKK